MADRRAYPSDLSDARWELIESVLSARRFERRGRALDFGRPPRHDLREIMNAILYVDRTGCQWAYLPHDFPAWQSVYGYFARWQNDGIFAQLNGLLRELVRQQEGKQRHPSACVIDAQSIKTSTSVPARSQGIHASKKIVGRKRSIITDTHLRLAHAPPPTGPRLRDLPSRIEAMIHLAMADLMARRLTGEGTVSWRDPTSPDQIRITG